MSAESKNKKNSGWCWQVGRTPSTRSARETKPLPVVPEASTTNPDSSRGFGAILSAIPSPVGGKKSQPETKKAKAAKSRNSSVPTTAIPVAWRTTRKTGTGTVTPEKAIEKDHDSGSDVPAQSFEDRVYNPPPLCTASDSSLATDMTPEKALENDQDAGTIAPEVTSGIVTPEKSFEKDQDAKSVPQHRVCRRSPRKRKGISATNKTTVAKKNASLSRRRRTGRKKRMFSTIERDETIRSLPQSRSTSWCWLLKPDLTPATIEVPSRKISNRERIADRSDASETNSPPPSSSKKLVARKRKRTEASKLASWYFCKSSKSLVRKKKRTEASKLASWYWVPSREGIAAAETRRVTRSSAQRPLRPCRTKPNTINDGSGHSEKSKSGNRNDEDCNPNTDEASLDSNDDIGIDDNSNGNTSRISNDNAANDARIQLEKIKEWEEKFRLLVEFKKKHKTLKIPNSNKALRNWVDDQRGMREELSSHQHQCLDLLGFKWNVRQSRKTGNGHDKTSTPTNSKRYMPLNRTKISQPRLKRKRMDILKSKDLKSADDKWMKMYKRLVAYKEKHNSTRVPKNYSTGTLSAWVTEQRVYLHKSIDKKRETEKVKLLNNIGFKRRLSQDVQWMTMYKLLVEYQKEHGHADVHQRKGGRLGNWVHSQRSFCEDPERMDLLNKLNFTWNVKRARWMEMYEQLIEYKKKYGNVCVPQRYEENPTLGKWVQSQRTVCNQQYRKDLLKEIGFEWKAKRGIRQDFKYGRSITKNKKRNC